jgi:hypothetical protein
MYNSVPEGQADQVDVRALMKTRDELVDALVALKAAISEASREVQRDIYDLAEKKAAAARNCATRCTVRRRRSSAASSRRFAPAALASDASCAILYTREGKPGLFVRRCLEGPFSAANKS